MSTFENNNHDEYGYPLPPSSRMKLRKAGIRTSKGVLRTGIYLVMSLVGFFLWLRRAGNPTPLNAADHSAETHSGDLSRSDW